MTTSIQKRMQVANPTPENKPDTTKKIKNPKSNKAAQYSEHGEKLTVYGYSQFKREMRYLKKLHEHDMSQYEDDYGKYTMMVGRRAVALQKQWTLLNQMVKAMLSWGTGQGKEIYEVQQQAVYVMRREFESMGYDLELNRSEGIPLI